MNIILASTILVFTYFAGYLFSYYSKNSKYKVISQKRGKSISILFLPIIALFIYFAGDLSGYVFLFNKNSGFKVDEKLFSAMAYIQCYEKQHEQFPSRVTFNKWSEKKHSGYEFEYYPNFFDKVGSQENNFLIGAWTGDEMQYFHAWEKSFTSENAHKALLRRMNGAKLGSNYTVKEGEISAPFIGSE